MTGEIQFFDRGPATHLQDLGRPGLQALGISPSGAMDPDALRLANALVGNDENAAALEFALLGPTLTVSVPLTLAIVGDCSPKIDGASLDSHRSVTLRPGQRLQVGALKTQRYGVLAFAARPAFPPSLGGSYATHLRTGVGDFEGERLRLTECRTTPSQICQPLDDDDSPIAFILGPQDDHFSAEEIERFCNSAYQIDPLSDRMGYRLSGPALSHRPDKGADIVSDGIALGSIQVPANGQPIVLMADRHTMGGYPKIGTVCTSQMRRLCQRRPGAVVRFQAVSAAEGVQRRRRSERQVKARIGSIAPLAETRQPDSELLLRENLIDGVFAAQIPR